MNMSKLHFCPLPFDLALHFWLVEAVSILFIQYLNGFPLIKLEQQLLVHLNTTDLNHYEGTRINLNEPLHFNMLISLRHPLEVNIKTRGDK